MQTRGMNTTTAQPMTTEELKARTAALIYTRIQFGMDPDDAFRVVMDRMRAEKPHLFSRLMSAFIEEQA